MTVVVPSRDGGDRLRALLRSLAGQTIEHELIVVDNGSPPGAMDAVELKVAGAELIRFERNAGFARAVNRGAAAASGDAILVLNDDCTCEPGFVEAISRALDPGAGTAMAAAVMRQQRDPELIDTAGIELDKTLFAFDYLNGERIEVLDDGVAAPFGPSGAAAIFDRDAFLAVGAYDEELFAYGEDVDLAIRLRREGSDCGLAPDAIGTHAHSASLGSGSVGKNYLMGYGRGYLLRKWDVLVPSRLPAVAARELVICGGQAVLDRNLAGVRGRVRGLGARPRRHRYPAELLTNGPPAPSLRDSLERRLRRRLRIRSSKAPAGTRLPRRTLVVFHLAELSGPLRSLEPDLRWLAESGDVEVVIPRPGPISESLEFAEIEVRPYQALTFPRGPAALARASRRLAREVRMFRRLIRERRPELVIVVSAMLPAALLAARLEGAPPLLYAGELLGGDREAGRGHAIAGRSLAALNAKLAAGVAACSRAVAGQYRRARGPVETVLPPIGPHYGEGDGPAFRQRFEIPAAAPCIAVVGSLTEGRGQDLMIEALAAIARVVPDVRCVFVGVPHPRRHDEAYAAALRGQAVRAGVADAVRFCGHVDRVSDVYAAADVVVNPARCAEAFGRVSFEAAWAGTPVVATRVGAIAENLHDGESALLVPPESAADLAAAVIRLLEQPRVAAALASRARAFAEVELSFERSHDRFEHLLGALPVAR